MRISCRVWGDESGFERVESGGRVRVWERSLRRLGGIFGEGGDSHRRVDDGARFGVYRTINRG